MRRNLDRVRKRLGWMEREGIWPNGERYLWTDAFGLVLLVSLYHEEGDERYLDQARELVMDVDRVLGRPRGYRIGQAPERDGQYYHYLAMWMYALWRLGQVEPAYEDRAVRLVYEVHDRFVSPDAGVLWKMTEDLSDPYPGYGYGALDPFHGYVVYRLLDEQGLEQEVQEMRALVEGAYQRLAVPQDLGLGMMLWFTHFFPQEQWAQVQRKRSLGMLDQLWDPDGFFHRGPHQRTQFRFTNYGISIGLQANSQWPGRVEALHEHFWGHQSHNEYDRDAITHVMACSAEFPGELLRSGIQLLARGR